MERTGLTETQQRNVSAINDMIRRGQMPSTEKLRSAGAESRFALVPKGLLESVVRKNARLFEQRGASPATKPHQSRPPKPTEAFLRSQMALLDSEIEKTQAPTRRRNLMNFILS
jgi:hypothetical protein